MHSNASTRSSGLIFKNDETGHFTYVLFSEKMRVFQTSPHFVSLLSRVTDRLVFQNTLANIFTHEKRALGTVKVQTAEKVISRESLRSLLNPNERSQPRYNVCTDNHRINSVYQTQYSATPLEEKNVMTTSAKDRPQRSKRPAHANTVSHVRNAIVLSVHGSR